ncbi:transmembrane [Plasmopara halstedii]|uniref:Transmembrane n=1 Tax=Plasmopara halstedii TaxID=4781 RepID=A0A0P1APK1_PLAHL|nr:transmembrane [Plasmopara halstedii]CEG42980.1 transmembrane [Plasmopara halstedii]|eukprot:XP_024579349.1 transmembrane [Plasmopara halstedii]
MPSECSSKDYSFISEGSFCVESTVYDWYRITDHDGIKENMSSSKGSRALRTQSSTPTDDVDDVLYPTMTSQIATSLSTMYDNGQIDCHRLWMDSEIPIVGRSSSAPPSIQLLQEVIRPSERTRAATAPSAGVFNHLLYGSLRGGASVELFSHPFYGLAISAAATGFMTPFLAEAFQPLLCVYLSSSTDQCTMTLQLLHLPGVASFFIGLLSDFYPIRSFHRKSYMLGGWMFAYLALMALVIVALIDDNTGHMNTGIRTFYGGSVYVLLMLATSLGITVASISAFAFLIELSQREPVHERGMLLVQYLLIQEVATLVSDVIISLVVGYNTESKTTEAILSMKVILLLMAVITLMPIPAVLLRLEEEPRQLKVDSIDRSSLTHQLWRILQQQAVWRILVFVCLFVFLTSFKFTFADDAVLFWARASPHNERFGAVLKQTILILSILVFQFTLFNHSWVRFSIGGLLLGIICKFIAAIPTIFNGVRSAWYTISILSLLGISRATVLLVTSLPIVEITENCLEGATTGLVASYTTVIHMVILTLSNALSTSSTELIRDFSDAVIAQDSSDTRLQVLSYIMANCAINIMALVPIVYLLPRQKLEAQEMRIYGEYNRKAGILVILVFVGLILYAASVNFYALLTDTT